MQNLEKKSSIPGNHHCCLPTLIHPFINFRHIVNNWTDNLRNQYHTLFIYNELIMLISNQQTVNKQPENMLSTNS